MSSPKVLNGITYLNGPISTWTTKVFRTKWKQQQPRIMTRRLLNTIKTKWQVSQKFATLQIASLADCDSSSLIPQPLLARTSGKYCHFTDSKSQLCNKTCKISKAHTEACIIACQTATQMTASATHVNSICKSCNNTRNTYQTCYR